MKMSQLFGIALLGLALVASPVYAQRGGGGGRSGGGSHSSSMSSSRGGGGSYSSSRGGSGSYSSSRGGSYSSSRSSSYSSPRSSASRSSMSSSPSRSSSSYQGSSRSNSQVRSNSIPSQIRSREATSPRSSSPVMRNNSTTSRGSQPAMRSNAGGRSSAPAGTRGGVNTPNDRNNGTVGRPTGQAPKAGEGRPQGQRWADAGHPHRPMPPSHRPIHPAPYFWHPVHHCVVHCHPLYWDPWPCRAWYWPGFWVYCNTYWYDYHPTDVVIVREYAKTNYNIDLLQYAMSGDLMYALVQDPDGHNYIQVYDNSDKLLAEQQVSRKYIKMEIDPQNGGVWIMKKRDKDPLMFLYSEGQLLIYEAD